ncbi:MAG: non-ribosomal peptide synthetase [Lachnospiraceae bacterium]|nr:non-ribosomal peptide synthetase [Lachnospiraceae bacterium]
MKFYEKLLLKLENETHSMQTVYKHMCEFSDEIAFEYSRNLIVYKITYAECRREILRIHDYLKRNTQKDDVVAISMDNSPLWVECFWAVLMSGCRGLLLSKNMTDRVFLKSLEKTGCRLVLGDRNIEEIRTVSCEELKSYRPDSATITEPSDGWGDEIILSTSATTGEPGLYAYTGKEICCQILNSGYVLKNCRDVSRFWHGQFRLLAFLPFSHIFGLTACYLWFTIFGRTFVFLEDLAPTTIMRTCRLHNVTHIMAVPLLWDALARGIKAEAEKTGEAERLEKGIKISLKLQDNFPALARFLVPKMMKSVQKKTFGKAVRFCISGGGICNSDTGRIVNGCGYHLENGYGMTEIGIASVTLHKKASKRDGSSVGKMFPSYSYRINEEGHLLVRGDTCYYARYTDGKRIERNKDEWFDTGDCFLELPDGNMKILGRSDDIINGANGERISPEMIEADLELDMPVCVFETEKGLTLLVEADEGAGVLSDRREKIIKSVSESIEKLPSAIRPRNILYTYSKIPHSLSYKVCRKEVIDLVLGGKTEVFDTEQFRSSDGGSGEEKEVISLADRIAGIMRETLRIKEAVNIESDFFATLGGDSLTYMDYLNSLEQAFNIKIPQEMTAGCITPVATAKIIKDIVRTRG